MQRGRPAPCSAGGEYIPPSIPPSINHPPRSIEIPPKHNPLGKQALRERREIEGIPQLHRHVTVLGHDIMALTRDSHKFGPQIITSNHDQHKFGDWLPKFLTFKFAPRRLAPQPYLQSWPGSSARGEGNLLSEIMFLTNIFQGKKSGSFGPKLEAGVLTRSTKWGGGGNYLG